MSLTGRRLAAALLAVALGLSLAGCYPASPSPTGQQISDLYKVFFVGGAVVVVLIWVLLAFVVLRYRRRDDRVPRQVHGYLPIQIVWTVVPLAIVLGLFGLTAYTMGSVGATSPEPGVQVHVWAFRWQWRFDYPGRGISIVGKPGTAPELVVPVGTPIHITLDSLDVDHSFYVPIFLFKRDAIPGVTNHFDVVVDQPGTYGGQCAEYCGVQHDAMIFSVRAVPKADFVAWAASQPHGPLPTPPSLIGPGQATPEATR